MVESEICKLYKQGNSINKIAQLSGIYKKKIRDILTENNIKIRKINYTYNYDENFFQLIDSEEKAYFLGFITADGSLHNKRTYLSIEINNQDISILKSFQKSIQSNHKIYHRTRTHKSGSQSKMSNLVINGKIHSDLIKLGIKPNKTKTIKWNDVTKNIPKKLLHHFVRGYFDGDGWFVSTRYAYGFISGSEDFISGLANYLEKQKCLSNGYRSIKSGYHIQVNGRLKYLNFHKLIYEDATIFCERKKNMGKEVDYKETRARKTGPKP